MALDHKAAEVPAFLVPSKHSEFQTPKLALGLLLSLPARRRRKMRIHLAAAGASVCFVTRSPSQEWKVKIQHTNSAKMSRGFL